MPTRTYITRRPTPQPEDRVFRPREAGVPAATLEGGVTVDFSRLTDAQRALARRELGL